MIPYPSPSFFCFLRRFIQNRALPLHAVNGLEIIRPEPADYRAAPYRFRFLEHALTAVTDRQPQLVEPLCSLFGIGAGIAGRLNHLIAEIYDFFPASQDNPT